MKLTRVVTASYKPNVDEIVASSSGLVSCTDAQFDYPGWVEYGVKVEGDKIPAGLQKPKRIVNGTFPKLMELLPGTHTFDGTGGLIRLPKPTRVGPHNIGIYPTDHVVHVDPDGNVWAVTTQNHYDPARATEVTIEIIDPITFQPWVYE